MFLGQLLWMAPFMKTDEPANPMNVGLFRPPTVATLPEATPNDLHELKRPSGIGRGVELL